MGEIIIMDKTKADNLLSLGFKYITRSIDNKEVFVFIQTNELMQELNSKFEEGSFLLSNDERYIIKSIHEKTKKKYWLFEGTDELNKLLSEWRLRKH